LARRLVLMLVPERAKKIDRPGHAVNWPRTWARSRRQEFPKATRSSVFQLWIGTESTAIFYDQLSSYCSKIFLQFDGYRFTARTFHFAIVQSALSDFT